MKIALIHIRLMHKGGLETRLFNYMQYFRNRGDEVTIISSKVSPDIVLPPDVQLVKYDLSKYPRIFRHPLFSNWLAKYLRQHHFDYSLSLERTWGQQKIIAPNTHIGYLHAQKKWWRTPSDWVQLYLDKKAFRLSDAIYACSAMVRQEIIDSYGISANKVQVLFPPLNTTQFNLSQSANREVWQKKYGIDNQKTNFVFVSTSHKRKGLDTLLAVFSAADMQDKHLYVAGTPFQTKLPNVHSLGFVKESYELYAAVDCTLHPSVYEPFGQIISESIACGTFVMVSDRVGAKEILNKNRGKVIPYSDLKAWHAAISSFQKTSIPVEDIEKLGRELSIESHMQVLTK